MDKLMVELNQWHNYLTKNQKIKTVSLSIKLGLRQFLWSQSCTKFFIEFLKVFSLCDFVKYSEKLCDHKIVIKP